MERRPRTLFQLDTPFSSVPWPTISLKDQEAILELLCSLLSPIGHHRSAHAVPSKGKRSKKRKHRESKEEPAIPPAPAPEIASSVLIGFNSTNRHLESKAAKATQTYGKPPQQTSQNEAKSIGTPLPNKDAPASKASDSAQDSRHLAAIFVSRSTQPSVLHANLPLLVATASLASPDKAPTRLVQLPKSCETRLSAVLGVPRVNFIGLLEDAPHSKAILDVVRGSVMDIEVPWLEGIKKGTFLPTNINAIETSMPVVSKTKT